MEEKRLAQRIEREVIPLLFRNLHLHPEGMLLKPKILPVMGEKLTKIDESYDKRELKRILTEYLYHLKDMRERAERMADEKLKLPYFKSLDDEEMVMRRLRMWARRKRSVGREIENMFQPFPLREELDDETRKVLNAIMGQYIVLFPFQLWNTLFRSSLLEDEELKPLMNQTLEYLRQKPSFLRGEWYVKRMRGDRR